MSTLEIVRLVNMILNLAASFGVNLAKLNAMRELNGGKLSEEQMNELAEEARSAVERM